MAHAGYVNFLTVRQYGFSTFQPLDCSTNHHIYLEMLENNNIDALHTLGVHPIGNHFQ